MADFISVDDIIKAKRPLTAEETERARAVIPLVCDSVRHAAYDAGESIDAKINTEPGYLGVVKSVCIDVSMREIQSSTTGDPMTQMSQSGLGYTVSGSLLVPGGGIFIKKNELAKLGLLKQEYGFIDLFGGDKT